jgi:hypothetical protein
MKSVSDNFEDDSFELLLSSNSEKVEVMGSSGIVLLFL